MKAIKVKSGRRTSDILSFWRFFSSDRLIDSGFLEGSVDRLADLPRGDATATPGVRGDVLLSALEEGSGAPSGRLNARLI